jgi:hypothetical protein
LVIWSPLTNACFLNLAFGVTNTSLFRKNKKAIFLLSFELRVNFFLNSWFVGGDGEERHFFSFAEDLLKEKPYANHGALPSPFNLSVLGYQSLFQSGCYFVCWSSNTTLFLWCCCLLPFLYVNPNSPGDSVPVG